MQISKIGQSSDEMLPEGQNTAYDGRRGVA
jgi:hypothetical protein